MLILARENPGLTKINLELNILKSDVVAEIEQRCLKNKLLKQQSQVPLYKRQLKCLRKIQGDFNVLPELTSKFENNKEQISYYLHHINEAESTIELQRNQRHELFNDLRLEMQSNDQILLDKDLQTQSLKAEIVVKQR